jgi:hypothetical protein
MHFLPLFGSYAQLIPPPRPFSSFPPAVYIPMPTVHIHPTIPHARAPATALNMGLSHFLVQGLRFALEEKASLFDSIYNIYIPSVSMVTQPAEARFFGCSYTFFSLDPRFGSPLPIPPGILLAASSSIRPSVVPPSLLSRLYRPSLAPSASVVSVTSLSISPLFSGFRGVGYLNICITASGTRILLADALNYSHR